MPKLNNSHYENVAKLKVQSYMEPEIGLNNTDIVQKVYGYNRECSRKNAHRIMTNEVVKSRVVELLQEKMTPEFLAFKGKQLINFKKHIVDKNGKCIAKIPDGSVQLEAWKTLLKISGALKENGIDVDQKILNINMDDESITRIESAVNSIKRLTDKLNISNANTINGKELVKHIDSKVNGINAQIDGEVGVAPSPFPSPNPSLTPLQNFSEKRAYEADSEQD